MASRLCLTPVISSPAGAGPGRGADGRRHPRSASVISRTTRAGAPATTVIGGTGAVTTLPAPTTEPRPTVTPGSDQRTGPDPHVVLDAHRRRELRAVPAQVRVDGVAGGADGHVRGEHHPVPDEDLDVVDEVRPKLAYVVVARCTRLP